jgi:hypothetical protein
MSSSNTRESADDALEQRVLAKCEFFTDVQLWPLRLKLDPERWLRNFLPEERLYATQLLNAFLYFSEDITSQLFEAAVRSLSLLPAFPHRLFLQAQSQWRAFLDTALFTQITGERPNPTDSGYTFLRMARQQLNIGQNQMMTPAETADLLLTSGPRPVVFVDDFVGSGRQCVETWKREMELPNGNKISFEVLSTVYSMSFYYCPLISTSQGYQRLHSECPGLHIACAHVLDSRYSTFSPDSIIWPDSLRPGAEEFIFTASQRAGIPSYKWRGFADLGLALAFAHCVPDATLPLFYWDENGWQPLIRRT